MDNTNPTHRLRPKAEETKWSLRKITAGFNKLGKVCARVFMQPGNTLYGVFGAVLSVLMAMWFANIAILQTVFTSSALPLTEKLDFMFTMFGTLMRNLEPLQIILIIIHFFLWAIISAFWLEALKRQHRHPRLKTTLGPSILATLCIGAAVIIAISLVTPVITGAGISVFVSSHYSGVVLLLFSLLMELVLIKRFAVLLHRTRDYS